MPKHPLSKTPTYWTWRSIRQRCGNPNQEGYRYWGARGVTVCERWRSFANFVADMGAKPEGMSIERIDNTRGYEPGNCRWATPLEQAANTRNVKLVVLDGEHVPVNEAIRRLGLRLGAIHNWVRRGKLTHQQAVDHYVSLRHAATSDTAPDAPHD